MAYADEWTPIYGRPTDFPGTLAGSAEGAVEAGRAPSACRCSRLRRPTKAWPRLRELGVSRAIFTLPSVAEERELLGLLDHLAAIAALG